MSSNQPTRRELMRNTVLAGEVAAAAALLGQVTSAWAAEQSLAINKHERGVPYKIGILGCGNRSKAHIGALNHVPEIEIAALCDVVEHKLDQRAKLITKKQDAPRKYVDMEKMLAQEDLDAIAVVLPNHLHKMATIAALQAGKHVFCEKPMALTVADCNEMIANSERTRKALQIGTQRRHGPGYQKAVEAIRKAPIGKMLSSAVNSYRGDWRQPAADEYPPGVKYWRMNQEQCGGVVYEMGAHIIDLNNWIFDSEPVTVVSLQGVNDLSLRPRDSMDHGGVLVRYANDALMNYGGNLYTHGPAAADYFFAVKGTMALGDATLEINYGRGTGIPGQDQLTAPTKIDLPGGDGTNDQWKYFAKVLAGAADPYPNGHTGRQSIQICQGSVISAREKTIVNVKDLG
jgi:predicted dehydrogenase